MQHLSAASSYLYYVSDLFKVFLELLFNFPSRYYYTIGLVIYLDLEFSAPHIHASFPRDTTQEIPIVLTVLTTGLSPFLVKLSRMLINTN